MPFLFLLMHFPLPHSIEGELSFISLNGSFRISSEMYEQRKEEENEVKGEGSVRKSVR